MTTQHLLPIYMPDSTYGQEDTFEEWEANTAKLKSELEAEFGCDFEYTDIGPGWSEPAYVTMLPLDGLVIGAIMLFFKGKDIADSLAGWSEIFAKIKSFLTRGAVYPKEGAAIVAVKAIEQEIGRSPSSIRLIGYKTHNVTWEEEPELVETDISGVEGPRENDQGIAGIAHLFLIEADGQRFKVMVRGSEITVVEV